MATGVIGGGKQRPKETKETAKAVPKKAPVPKGRKK